MRFRNAVATLLVLACAPALAGNAEWVGRNVRVSFGAEHAMIPGKVTRLDICLYVKLDAARDGITLIRLDQVTSLQSRQGSAWVVQDLQLLLRQEPKHCFDEANG